MQQDQNTEREIAVRSARAEQMSLDEAAEAILAARDLQEHLIIGCGQPMADCATCRTESQVEGYHPVWAERDAASIRIGEVDDTSCRRALAEAADRRAAVAPLAPRTAPPEPDDEIGG